MPLPQPVGNSLYTSDPQLAQYVTDRLTECLFLLSQGNPCYFGKFLTQIQIFLSSIWPTINSFFSHFTYEHLPGFNLSVETTQQQRLQILYYVFRTIMCHSKKETAELFKYLLLDTGTTLVKDPQQCSQLLLQVRQEISFALYVLEQPELQLRYEKQDFSLIPADFFLVDHKLLRAKELALYPLCMPLIHLIMLNHFQLDADMASFINDFNHAPREEKARLIMQIYGDADIGNMTFFGQWINTLHQHKLRFDLGLHIFTYAS